MTESDIQKRILWKLKELKIHTKAWQKEVVRLRKGQLTDLEKEINLFIHILREDPVNPTAASHLWRLEISRNGILRDEEDLW